MRSIAALLVTGSLIVLFSGCTAYKHNKAGDAAAQTGDMRSAVYHYEQALANKERYARDADFLMKLATARSRVAFDEAKKLRVQGRYEPALQQLRKSLRQDPGYADPAVLLPVLLKEAAQWRYTKAVAAADHGDLDAAREHLMRSMQHDMTDEASAYAMASLTPSKLNADTPGLAGYRAGVSQSAERHWAIAEQTFLKSIGDNAGLLPARASLHEARAQLAEARRLQRDGQALIDQLTMGPAIQSLNRSLDIWPFNTQAQSLLTQAKTQQALADEQFTQATQAAGRAKWDDAIALADNGLAIDRSHPGLEALRGALPRRAAADHTRRGDAHRDKGELGQAHQSYSRALSYRDTYRDARLGMARIYASWGESHEQAGRLGAARLHFAKGQSYTREKTLDEGVVRTSAAVRDRLGVGLSISADEQGRTAIDPKQVRSALVGSLQSKRSHGLSIQKQGMPYELRLTIRKATIDERLTNTSRRTHHYTTQELRHNPEYDRVAWRYDRECETLRSLESRLSSFRCKGHPNGGVCGCFSGSHYNSLKHQVSRQRGVVRSAKHKLSCTPRQIRVMLHHEWDYTVETYTKTGELSVITKLIDTATGKAVKRFTHQSSFAQSDNRTLNANPSVGVRHDDLHLASDDTVRGALTDELASAAGPWAVNALVDHQLAMINAAVDAHEQQGKSAEALEARVDRAVLLGIVDRKASQHALDKLTESHTR